MVERLIMKSRKRNEENEEATEMELRKQSREVNEPMKRNESYKTENEKKSRNGKKHTRRNKGNEQKIQRHERTNE